MSERPRDTLDRRVREAREAGHTILPEKLAAELGLDTGEVYEALSRADANRTRSFGDYEILGELGRGSMGIVYRARQEDLGREIALKMLFPILSGNTTAVERFRREAEAAARIRHPNLLHVYEFGAHHDTQYYTMELVEGGSLDDLIERWRSAGHDSAVDLGSERLRTVLARFIDLIEAVGEAHAQGIFHRDVKPSNILVDAGADPDDWILRLADFGLAKDITKADLTLSRETMGTPAYMSPEQARDGRIVDARSDIYSLGMTLYYLLTFRMPFTGSATEVLSRVPSEDPAQPSDLGIRLPTDLVAVVYRAIEKDPASRYSTASDLAADLRRFVEGRVVQARPRSPLSRLVKRLRRHRRTALLILAASILGIVGSFLVARFVLPPTGIHGGEGKPDLQALIAEGMRPVAEVRFMLGHGELGTAIAFTRDVDGTADIVAFDGAGETLWRASDRPETWKQTMSTGKCSVCILRTLVTRKDETDIEETLLVEIRRDSRGCLVLFDPLTGRERGHRFYDGRLAEPDGSFENLVVLPSNRQGRRSLLATYTPECGLGTDLHVVIFESSGTVLDHLILAPCREGGKVKGTTFIDWTEEPCALTVVTTEGIVWSFDIHEDRVDLDSSEVRLADSFLAAFEEEHGTPPSEQQVEDLRKTILERVKRGSLLFPESWSDP